LVGREFYSSKQAATNSPAATETPAVIEASPQTEKSVKTEEPPDDQAMAQPPFAQIPIKQWRSGDWVLQFPDEHLGAIGFTERGFYPARGTVPLKMAGPLLFRPTRNGLRRDILARFRPDELYKILLRENENVDDNVMKSLARLTGLIELDLSGDTNVTDDGLAAISKLPKLVNLAVSGASVTGAGLANMHNLGQLAFLEADGLQDGRKVVPALARSKRIRDLYLRKDGLTDQDLEALGRVPSLEKLNVAVNRQITDLGISKLENIRQLKELNVVETGITPNCIQYLKRLPSGAWLWISTRGWTQEQRHQLNAALAGKRIMGSTEPITPD